MARHWIAPQWGTPDVWRFEEYVPPAPGPGEVTLRVHAAGINPADAKHVAAARPGVALPVAIGYEVSGEITAIGPDTEIGSGPAAIGDEVLAFRVSGGYATELTIPAGKAFRKPSTLTHPEAANLLLTGTTAAEMLAITRAAPGETVLLHAASGAVGVSVLQQAALIGVRVIGTASPGRAEDVRRFGGIPIAYGPGLAERIRAAMSDAGVGRIDAALDAVGTDEAIATSLEFVPDRSRIVTIVAAASAQSEGFAAIAGSMPASAVFRDEARSRLIELAGRGDLVVPVARTYPLSEAPAAHAFLGEGHPGGAIALIP